MNTLNINNTFCLNYLFIKIQVYQKDIIYKKKRIMRNYLLF